MKDRWSLKIVLHPLNTVMKVNTKADDVKDALHVVNIIGLTAGQHHTEVTAGRFSTSSNILQKKSRS